MSDQNRLDRHLDRLGASGGSFSQVLRMAKAFAALDRELSPLLPEALATRIGVACVRDRTLVLAAADAAAAARARLMAAELMRRANTLWPEPVTHWKVVVVPEIRFDRPSPRT